MPEDDPEGRMLLDCDGCPVYVDASALPGVLDGLKENTVVDVSGTCALDVDAPERTLAIPRGIKRATVSFSMFFDAFCRTA